MPLEVSDSRHIRPLVGRGLAPRIVIFGRWIARCQAPIMTIAMNNQPGFSGSRPCRRSGSPVIISGDPAMHAGPCAAAAHRG